MQDLTEDFDYNAMNVVWEGNDRIWFIAPIEATHQICRISPSVGEVEVVTRGDHDINAFSMAGDRIVAEMCTISMATEFFGVDPADGTLTQLSAINKPVYDNIRMGEVRETLGEDHRRQADADVGDPAARFRPGPRSTPCCFTARAVRKASCRQFWSYRWNFQLMAAQGYVVVAPNRRGLPSFGQEWLDQISGDYAGQNIRDYLSCHRRRGAGSRGPTRPGWAAWAPATAATRSSSWPAATRKRFKAFIAHCGIFNFESRCTASTEELFFIEQRPTEAPTGIGRIQVATALLRQFAAQIRAANGTRRF